MAFDSAAIDFSFPVSKEKLQNVVPPSSANWLEKRRVTQQTQCGRTRRTVCVWRNTSGDLGSIAAG